MEAASPARKQGLDSNEHAALYRHPANLNTDHILLNRINHSSSTPLKLPPMRLFSIVLLVSCATCQTLVLSHVTVIDGTSSPARNDQTVVITNGVLAEVGRNALIPHQAHVIDARGKFLIPGLWDMHTHVAGITADPKWGKSLLPQYLAYGITSIRDMAGDVEALFSWERETDEGRLRGPRMFIAGPFIDGSSHGFTFPTDVIAAPTPESGREAVRRLKARGVNFIKVGSQLSRETFFAIAEESRLQHVPFAGHVPDSVTPLEASNAGMVSQEHLLGIALSISNHEQKLRQAIASARANDDRQAYSSAVAEAQDTLDEAKARELFATFNRNRTWIVPTLSWTDTTSKLSQQSDASKLHFIPEELAQKWQPGKRLISDAAEAYYARKLQCDLRIINLMHRAGVRLLAGSDSLDPWVLPGDSLHHELEMLVRAGLSPLEALQAATANPAEFFGLQNEMGTIAKGKRADLVLLNANPLEDISNTRQIVAVIQGGNYMTRNDLLKAAEKLSNSMNVTNTQNGVSKAQPEATPRVP